MSLSLSADSLRKLTPDRLCVSLLTGAFLEHPDHPLKNDPQFWAVVLPFFNTQSDVTVKSPSKEAGMLNLLLREFGREKLLFFGEYLADHNRSVSTLQTKLELIFNEVTKNESIRSRSFLGSVSSDVWYCFAVLDITEATQVWRLLRDVTDPFVKQLGVNEENAKFDELQNILGNALIWKNNLFVRSAEPNGKETNARKNLDEISSYRAVDVSLIRENIHRECDLDESAEHGYLVLAETYAAQGNIDAALEVVNEAFLRDRRSLIREMRSNDADAASSNESLKEVSARNNRELVGWLQNLLSMYGKPGSAEGLAPKSASTTGTERRLPPALDVPVNQLQYYFSSTASTPAERIEAYIQQLQSDVAAGTVTKLEPLFAARSLLGSLFQPENSHLVIPYYFVTSQIWHAFGLTHLCENYLKLAKERLKSESRPSISSELALLDALNLQCPIEGLAELAAIHPQDWSDISQSTFALVTTQSLILAHDCETARVALEQVNDIVLPVRQKEARSLIEIMLELHQSNYYSAFLLAYKRSQHHAARNAIQLELQHLVWAARALTLAEKDTYAAQAHIIIDDTLQRSLKTHKLGVALELMLLKARLLFNKGDYETCLSICRTVKPLIAACSVMKLRCEWKLLQIAASYLLGSSSGEKLESWELAKCLYTEFNDQIANIAEKTANVRFLRHRSNDSQTSKKILSHAIQSEFPGIASHSESIPPAAKARKVYEAYIEQASLNTSKEAAATLKPSPNAISTSLVSGMALSDDDSGLKLHPQKRTWSINGSPQRRNSKRRSFQLH